MSRVTQIDLQRAVDNLNKRYPRNDGYQYAIDWAYNQPALVTVDGKDCGRTLSPRVRGGELMVWIRAYADGLEEMDLTWRRRLKEADPLIIEMMRVESGAHRTPQ